MSSAHSTSRRRWLQVAAGGTLLIGAAALSAGCIIVDDDYHGPHYYYGPDYYDEPVYETIDTDQVLTTELGEGVGLFVEYGAGGTWRLWTACDTFITGYACEFDIYVVAGSSISNVVTEDLEGYDHVDLSSNDSFVFYAETATAFDAVSFETQAGVDLQLELVLDGYVEPRFIYWVGDGTLHEGATGTPVIFTPSEP